MGLVAWLFAVLAVGAVLALLALLILVWRGRLGGPRRPRGRMPESSDRRVRGMSVPSRAGLVQKFRDSFVTDEAPDNDLIQEIHDSLIAGERFIIVGGPVGGGQEALLAKLVESAERLGDLRVTEVIDLTTQWSPDDLLEAVARSLTSHGQLRHFTQRLSIYRARTAGRKTKADQLGSAAQLGLTAVGSLAPVVGPAVSKVGESEITTDVRQQIVDRFQGAGDLGEVYSAFITDLLELAAEEPALVLILDGIDDRPDDPGVSALLRRVLPHVARAVAIVASAHDPDVDLGPAFVRRKSLWLEQRMTDAQVRDELRQAGLATSAIDELAAVVGGNPERLKNVITSVRTVPFDKSAESNAGRLVALGRHWADSGQVLDALQVVDPNYQQAALALSAMRWFDRLLLEAVTTAAGVLSDEKDRAAELLGPEKRPPWLAADPCGWRIGNDILRRAMLEEFGRGNPDLLQAVHTAAASYHRSALWSLAGVNGPATSEDPLAVPRRAAHREQRDAKYVAHEAEWLYHRFALDAQTAFPAALDRAAEAVHASDNTAAIALLSLDGDVELPGSQSYVLHLLSEYAAASLADESEQMVRVLDQLLPLVPKAGTPCTILLCEHGIALYETDRPTLALRRFSEAYTRAARLVSTDVRCLRVACLANAYRGAILSERRSPPAGTKELKKALTMARRANDMELVADIHRLRVRVAFAQSEDAEQITREALKEIDVGQPSLWTAIMRGQLALALTIRDDPDYAEADRLLGSALDTCRALGDRDMEVQLLCQEAALSGLRGDTKSGGEYRRQALSLTDAPARAHSTLGNFASWSDDWTTAIREYRWACVVDTLTRLESLASPPKEAGQGHRPAIGDLYALLAIYANEAQDEPARSRYLKAAHSHISEDATDAGRTLLTAAEEGQTASEVVEDARRRCEATLFASSLGEPTLRETLGQMMSVSAPVDAVPAYWSEVAAILLAAMGPSAEEPRQALDVVSALRKAEEYDRADKVLESLLDWLQRRLKADPRDPELHAAHAEALAQQVGDGRSKDEVVAAFRRAYELDPDDGRLIDLTYAMSQAGAWTDASGLIEERIGQRGPKTVLLDEATRLLDPVQNATEQRRAENLARACPDDDRFATLAGRGLAASARMLAALGRDADTSVELGAEYRSAPIMPDGELADLLTRAVSWLRKGASASATPVEPLLDAAELLLDVSPIAPGDALPPWDVLRDVVPLLLADDCPEDERRRGERCLARLVRSTQAVGSDEAIAALEQLRQIALSNIIGASVLLVDPLERLIPPIRVLVGPALVEHLDARQNAAAQRLYDAGDGMLPTLRAALKETLGFAVPPVRVSSGPKDDDNGLTVLIRGAPRYAQTLPRPFAAAIDPDQLREITGEDGIAAPLAGGRPVVWLSGTQKRVLDRRGCETFDPRGLLCLVLAEVLSRCADELLQGQLVFSDILEAAGVDREVAWTRLPEITVILRRLAADGLTLSDSNVREVAALCGGETPFDFASTYASARARLAPTSLTPPSGVRAADDFVVLDKSDLNELLGDPRVQFSPAVIPPVLGWEAVSRVRRWAAGRIVPDDGVVAASDEVTRVSIAEVLRGAGVRARALVVDEPAPADGGGTS